VNGPSGDTNAERIEETVGRVLRLGVTASSLCLGAGLAASLIMPATGFTRALLTGGLLVLLATPASRVVVSAVVYVRSRDWLFVALTLVVLLELVASVVAALHASASL
jgi:uncharacterized membrane protein